MNTSHYVIRINRTGKTIRGNPEKYLKKKGYTCRILKNGKKAWYSGKHKVEVIKLTEQEWELIKTIYSK